MVIARYIGDLLYDYECVVIPGLGGFIINDRPAAVNYTTHYFKPPFREVMFNPYLRTNDGLLVNYIAKEENLTYQEAKTKMDAFAIACQRALDDGKQIRFDKVGTIRKDGNGNVVFNQDTSVNYNPNSFGLSPFISPAVNKISDEDRIREVIKKAKNTSEKAAAPARDKIDKPIDRKATTYPPGKQKKADGKVLVARRRSPYRSQFYFILLLLLGMLAGWGVMNKEIVSNYYAQYGSKLPVFYNNAGSYIANNVEILPIRELSKSASALWLVDFFKKDSHGNKSTALANDDLTFRTNPETTTQEEPLTASADNTKMEEDASANQDATMTTEAKPEEVVPATSEPATTPKRESVTTVEGASGSEPAEVSEETRPVEPVTQKEIAAEDNRGQASETISKETSPHYSYFIIAGSFKDHDNAVKLIKELQSKGFVAIAAGTNKYGMTRVAYAGFNTMEEAAQQLSIIRQHHNPSAWIMRK